MQRFITIVLFLFATYYLSAQTNTSIAETLRLTSAVSKLNDHYSEVIGYYLNKPLYMGDFNVHNLKQDINAAIYSIDPKSPAEKENNATQEYLSAKFEMKDSFEKEELTSLVSKAESETEKMKMLCISFSNYFSDKEYTKDQSFAKYTVLRDDLQKLILSAQDAWKRVVVYNTDVRDIAETEILHSKKTAEFVVPMKEDLDKLRKIVAQVYSQDFSAIILKMDVVDLQSTTDFHKNYSNKNINKLKDESYIGVYERFYTKTDECLTTVLKILNCVEQKKFDNELDTLFDSLNKAFSKAEEDYKLFASQD